MKMKINRDLARKVSIYALMGILVFFSTTGLLFNPSTGFLKETLNLSLSNLGLAAGIKILAGTVDFLEGIRDIVEKIFNYFLAINGLIFFQITLLKLSNMLFFRLLILSVCVLLFFKSIRKTVIKILVLMLFINPGLQFYVIGVKFISYQADLELGKSINAELRGISKSIDMQTDTDDKNSTQPEDGSKTSFIDRIKNFVGESINKTKKMLSSMLNDLTSAANRLLELVINYFISMMVLFLILPVIYFFVLYLIAKKYFYLK